MHFVLITLLACTYKAWTAEPVKPLTDSTQFVPMANSGLRDAELSWLVRQLAPDDTPFSSGFIHAGIGHAGVPSLVLKPCHSGEWRREMTYAYADAASAPDPGMTSLASKKNGSTLVADLRNAQGQARLNSLNFFYHGVETTHTQLAIRRDEEVGKGITLDNRAGAHTLNLQMPYDISSLQIRVIDGQLRFQGIQLSQAPSGAAWVSSELNDLASWFTTHSDNLAMIAFDTNEGNDPQFKQAADRDFLLVAVDNFRQVLSQSPCILIASACGVCV